MDIRKLTPDYAVSPQVAPEDMTVLRDAGFVTVIDNRPDDEIPPDLQTQAIRHAAEAAGLRFVANPVFPGAMNAQNLELQAGAIAESDGPVLAYCASGNRSSIVWAFLNAGELGVDTVIAATSGAGYQHDGLRPQLAVVARSQGDAGDGSA